MFVPDPKEFQQKARTYVANKYGAKFAEKATDEFCLMLYNADLQQFQPVTNFLESAHVFRATAPAPNSGHTSSSVIEFSGDIPTVKPIVSTDPGSFDKLKSAIRTFNNSPEGLLLNYQQVIQQQRIKDYRETILKSMASITTPLEKIIEGNFAQAARSIGSAESLASTCWLNQTVRTVADPLVLGEIAGDDRISKIDLPRRLVAEINQTGPLVDAPNYRVNSSKTGKGIIVGVIDTEVSTAHPALTGRVVKQKNYTKEPWGNPGAHGTAVAGIIGSNDAAYTGMAPEATIYNYKILGYNGLLNGTNFDGGLAIQDAVVDGVNIANCSWGDGPAGDGTSRLALACNNAWNLGMSIIKSAGNDGPGRGTLSSPADADGVIVVGATERDGKRIGDYSSRGPAFSGAHRPHLVAPGGSPMDGIFSCIVGGRFDSVGDGTSFAAPHVSGLLALILEEHDLSPDEQRNFLIKLCTKLPGFNDDDQGAGLISMISLIKP